MIEYVTRNFTGERTDEHFGMPMHRGLGPHSRGPSESIRGLGTLAPPSTFGHGGVGTSYCWADPESGDVVRLPEQQPASGPVAFAPAGPDQQLRARAIGES